MVKILSTDDKKAVAEAIAKAEQITSAELVAVVAPASDAYQSHLQLYGLIIGSSIATFLWAEKIMSAFPLLFAIQLAVMALFSFVPWLRYHMLWLVPKRTRYHRAAHRAYEEYLAVSQHVSADAPIVLLYISLAEHYAHIVTSRSVREKIPTTQWNIIINNVIATIPAEGIESACSKAISHAAELLAPAFPAKKKSSLNTSRTTGATS